MLYNFMFDLLATIDGDDFDTIPAQDLIAAMQKRLDYLKANLSEAKEAFGVVDVIENDNVIILLDKIESKEAEKKD